MKRNRTKLASKVLGGIAAVLLALVFLPGGAGAPDQAQAEGEFPVYWQYTQTWNTGVENGLQTAIDWLHDNPDSTFGLYQGVTLQLQRDIQLDDNPLSIPSNVRITIDLNGHSITGGGDNQPFVYVEGTVSFINSSYSRRGALSAGSHRSYVQIKRDGSLQLGILCTISASGYGASPSYAVECYGTFLCNGNVESTNSAAKAVGVFAGATFESNGQIAGDVEVQGGTMYAGSSSSISGALNISMGSTLSKSTPGSFFDEAILSRHPYGTSTIGAHKVTFKVGGNTIIEYYANSAVVPPYGSGFVESPAVAWNLNGNHYDFSEVLDRDIELEGVKEYEFSLKDIEQEYTGSEVPASAIQGTASVGGTKVDGTWQFVNSMREPYAPSRVVESGPVSVLFTPNDKSYGPAFTSVSVTIKPVSVTAVDPVVGAKTYDGTTSLDVQCVSFVRADDRSKKVDLIKGTDYQVTNAKYDSADAGDAVGYSYSVQLLDPNYALGGSGTFRGTGKIAKAAAPYAHQVETLEIQNRRAETYTFDFASLLPQLEGGRDYGNLSYQLTLLDIKREEYVKAADITLSGSTATIPISDVDTTDAPYIGLVQVTAHSTNYEDVKLELALDAGNGGDEYAQVTQAPKAKQLTYNGKEQQLVEAGAADDGDILYSLSEETGSFGESVPYGKDAGAYTVWYYARPATSSKQPSSTRSVQVTIAKATPTVSVWPTLRGQLYVGDELDDSKLSGGTANVNGTFLLTGSERAWDTAGARRVPVSFVPADAKNYARVEGSVDVTVSKRTLASVETAIPANEDKLVGTQIGNLGLPDKVDVKTEDGKVFHDVPVSWGGYSPELVERAQQLTGALDLRAIDGEVQQPETPVAAKATVTLRESTSEAPTFPDQSRVYTGLPVEHELAAPIGVASVTYSYKGIDGTSYGPSSQAPKDAGSYQVTATFEMRAGYRQLDSASSKLTIDRATPDVEAWPALSDRFHVGDTLEDSLLSTGRANVAGTFAIGGSTREWDVAGTHHVRLSFTPVDARNYRSLEHELPVVVSKRVLASVESDGRLITGETAGTKLGDLGLPDKVDVKTEDGKVFKDVPISAWQGYDPDVLGAQGLTGTLKLDGIDNEVEQPSGEPVVAHAIVILQERTAEAPVFPDQSRVYSGKQISHELAAPVGVESVAYTYRGVEGTTYGPTSEAPKDAGSYEVTAAFTMESGHAQLDPVSSKLTIDRANPVVSAWPTIGDIEVGHELVNSELKGGKADVDGTFKVTGSEKSWKSAGEKSVEVSFVPADARNYTTPTRHISVQVVESAKPAEPTEPSEPSDPTKPTEPSKPDQPSEPTKPDQPSEPSKDHPAAVEVPKTSGGSVTVGTDKAVSGDKVLVTVKPDAGKRVESVSVIGKDGTSIAVAKEADGTFSFTMPDEAVEVKVAFASAKPAGAPTQCVFSRASARRGGSLVITWTRVKNASGYQVYLAKRGSKGKLVRSKNLVKRVKGWRAQKATLKRLRNGKKLSKSGSYKIAVVAYRTVKGKKQTLSTSPTIYAAGAKHGRANVAKVKVSPRKMTLGAGKTRTIKATASAKATGKKLLKVKGVRSVRYYSSDSAVASVSATGKVTAKKPGKCEIYALAANGLRAKAEVVVR